MGPKTCVFICVGLFVAIQALLPAASALKRSSEPDEFMAEKRARQNYVWRARRSLGNEDVKDIDNFHQEDKQYVLRWPSAGTLLGLIFELYSNMIQNDVSLISDSLQTIAQKMGSIKVNKEENEMLPEIPCKCEDRIETVDLTSKLGIVYPYTVRNISCNDVCVKPFICEGQIYNMTVLKKRSQRPKFDSNLIEVNNGYDMPLPTELLLGWTPVKIPVTVRCDCVLR